MPKLPEELLGLAERVSNWGRWGPDDRRGTLNLIDEDAVRRGDNVFEELLETVKVASLGQISDALFDVGGRYRRSM